MRHCVRGTLLLLKQTKDVEKNSVCNLYKKITSALAYD